jgi:thiosulfate reductase cytochrome b subunit
MREPARRKTILIRRHGGLVRATHWINALALLVLLMSGLQIFNAHPALYWGHKSTFARPWIAMSLEERAGRPIGVTRVAGARFETTGLFGYSGPAGRRAPRGFPAWSTLPSYKDLASGRRWHFAFAWLFVLNGAAYLAAGIGRGRLRREILPTPTELAPRHLWREMVDHARLRFAKGEAARHYNVLQKLTYLAMIAAVLPLMVITGLCMSPGFNAAVPWLIDLFGGRQSARTVHFLCAGLIVAFVAVHVALVFASGFFNNMRGMITGRYAIDQGDT